jgi:hypothetical protein
MSSVSDLYRSATNTYGRTFNVEQCAAFERALHDFSAATVTAAFNEWGANTTPDFDGRALGSRMPMPADIRRLCEHLQSQVEAKRRGEFVACRNCHEGWADVTYSSHGKNYCGVRRCECWQEWRATQPAPVPAKPRQQRRPTGGFMSAGTMIPHQLGASA